VSKKKGISQEDINIWQNYIKNPLDIIDKDNSGKKNTKKNSRFKYDLHGYNLLAANKKVKEIILLCVKNKHQEVLLITGKGIHSNTEKDIYVSKDLSKLRYSVPEYIKSDPDISQYILSVSNAEKKYGGEGAIVIKLKNL
jgi:DNA-nicking Smr family endonuclease